MNVSSYFTESHCDRNPKLLSLALHVWKRNRAQLSNLSATFIIPVTK